MIPFIVTALCGLWVSPLSIGAALANEPSGELEIRVEPEVPPPRPLRARSVPRTLPWGSSGEIAVDGMLAEPTWANVPWAPPLDPFIDALAPSDVRLKVLRVPEGLAFAVYGLPEGASSSILVNPDGLQMRWWTVALDGDEVLWKVCDYEGRTFPFERSVLPRAAVCRRVEGAFRAHRAGEVWEVLFPWSALSAPTELIRVDWRVVGPGRRGGGWRTGDRELSPLHGLPLVAPASEAKLKVIQRADEGRFEARVVVPHAEAVEAEPGPWAWRLVYRDQVLEEGTVEVARTTDGRLVGRFEGPLPRLLRLGMVVVAPEGAPFPAAAVRWFSVEHQATLATPVFTDAIRVAYRVSSAQEGLRVSVADSDGAILGTGGVDLPRGGGMVWIFARAEWPDDVWVRIGERLLDAPAFRATGAR